MYNQCHGNKQAAFRKNKYICISGVRSILVQSQRVSRGGGRGEEGRAKKRSSFLVNPKTKVCSKLFNFNPGAIDDLENGFDFKKQRNKNK